MSEAGHRIPRRLAGLLAPKAPSPPAEPARRDRVSAAVARGARRNAADADAPATAIRQALSELYRAQREGTVEPALGRALKLVETYPASEMLQILSVLIVEVGGDAAASAQTWAGLVERFLPALDAFRTSMRQCIRTRGRHAALEEAEALDFEGSGLLSVGVRKAVAYEELAEYATADRIYAGLIDRYPLVELVQVEFCRALIARKLYVRALTAVTAAAARFPNAPFFRDSQVEISHVLADFELVAPGVIDSDGPLSCLLIEQLLTTFAAERAAVLAVPRPYLGATVLITGTLGLGGAERQVVMTAKGLARAARDEQPVEGRPVLGPITVCARDLDAAKGHDFFLQDVRAAGIDVMQYLSVPNAGGDARASLSTRYRNVMKFLPSQTVEGLQRLLDWLVWQRPDVVQIWQDGMVYATALAAVMAGVPRIVMSHRTLPPIDRRDRFKAEHEILYRTLAHLPGVTLTTNSLTAARRFEEWLALKPGSVLTIPNGTVAGEPSASDAVKAQAAAFLEATADATFTVGGIMRLDENKRPLEWVDVAVAFLGLEPTARFVVVGDGPLLASMREYVRLRGHTRRFLFVGRSHDVWYWLGHMDVLLMLSRYEGLPNAAIEAQMAGVPVIATPAGGTAEAIAPDSNGLLLPRADAVEVDEALKRLLLVSRDPALRRQMSAAARLWAEQTFSVERMIARTVAVMCA